MRLKSLTEKVWDQDGVGTRCGIYSHKMSREDGAMGCPLGTVSLSFQDLIEVFEERAAIMDFEVGLSQRDEEAAAKKEMK